MIYAIAALIVALVLVVLFTNMETITELVMPKPAIQHYRTDGAFCGPVRQVVRDDGNSDYQCRGCKKRWESPQLTPGAARG